MKFFFRGGARKVGAIGIREHFTAFREADNIEAARIALYDEWEHISIIAEGALVVRYVVTHIGRDGLRTLVEPAQGRHTYATEAEARQALADIIANNSDAVLRGLYGFPLEVRPCECWPGHFDPVGVYFD